MTNQQHPKKGKSRLTNEEIERHYFEQFRSHYESQEGNFKCFRQNYEIPKGDIVYTDSPDVMIHGVTTLGEVTTLGVEITRSYINDDPEKSEQVQRELREVVLTRAKSQAPKGEKYDLWIGFDPFHPILKKQATPIARELAEVVENNLDKWLCGHVPKQFFEHIPQVESIYFNPTEYSAPAWRTLQCYEGSTLEFKRVQEIVEKKSRKLQNYQKCTKYWLLIVINFIDRAQDQDLQLGAEDVLQKSPFECVLLYKHPFGELVLVRQSDDG
ncbi:hypothetical protein [Verminephrobacter aporrectodeae]|uniref:hypothetical protein n=1 Tax=Verminephrobacter aporrectodeae TaxID=1110389 RepID=UPI0022439C8E|nr:hypothetical protein [Verminephrobacter aporrectodeae]